MLAKRGTVARSLLLEHRDGKHRQTDRNHRQPPPTREAQIVNKAAAAGSSHHEADREVAWTGELDSPKTFDPISVQRVGKERVRSPASSKARSLDEAGS